MSRPSATRRDLLLLSALTAVAVAVRVFHLDYASLNGGDEPYTLALAQRPFLHMIGLFGYEANGTIYSIALWPLIRVFDQSEVVVRLPAVLAGVLAVPAIWWAGRELAGDRVGLIGAALMAVNPMAVAESQFGRPFTMVIALACVTFASLSVALRTGQRRWWALYAIALAACGYANGVTPFALLTAHAVIVYTTARERIRPWLFSVGAYLLASLPLFVALAIERSRRNPLFWLDRPGPGSVWLLGKEYTAGLSGSLAVYALTALVIGAALIWLVLRSHGEARGPIRRLEIPTALWAWALVPAVALFLFAQISPSFRPEYIIGVLPGCLLLVACLVDRLGGRLRWAALAALLALGAAGTTIQTTHQVNETWRSALGWIQQERRPGDRILLDSPVVFPVFGYYQERYRPANGQLSSYEWNPSVVPPDVIPLDDPGGYAGPPGPPTRQMISRLASGDRRLFVVLAEYVEARQGYIQEGDALNWARRNCRVIERDEVEINLYLISDCPRLAGG